MTRTIEIKVDVTAEDLEGECMNPNDCPGYRAVKRVVPSLTKWLFSFGLANDPRGKQYEVEGTNEMADTLISHHYYQNGCKGSEEQPAKKAEPFSCVIKVPFEVANFG